MKHLNESIVNEAVLKPSKDLLETGVAFQEFLNEVDNGNIDMNDSGAFRNFINQNKVPQQGWMDYIPYFFEYKHVNGKPWKEEEFDNLREKFDYFAL